ncbi:hypothetical protein Mapa_010665 [Marchantia paleacea]|nr:hypothetical protein Mapa_010665 [Marchantia paleacea]
MGSAHRGSCHFPVRPRSPFRFSTVLTIDATIKLLTVPSSHWTQQKLNSGCT